MVPPSSRSVAKAGIAGVAALGAAALWWRFNPSPCPYGQRFWVEAPHPLITRQRLIAALAPAAGQAILEVGPGTGYYTIAVAPLVRPEGRLYICDIQQRMLDHASRRLEQEGVFDVVAGRGDVQALPYADASFDACYLVTVLGEVPDQRLALSELRRVLRPDGRLVVGELFGDPHMVSLKALRTRAQSVGLRYEGHIGPRLGYFAVLRPAPSERSIAAQSPT